jgi:diguanylate cyclase (GGDEF)-like protein
LNAGLPVEAIPAEESLPSTAKGAVPEHAMVENIARVTEITRNIYRQASVKSVLFTAVNDIGRHWNASRCIAVLSTPGKPPSIALEYCGTGVQPSNVHAIVKLVAMLQPLIIAHGPLVIGSEGVAAWLTPLKQFASGLGIDALLAMPLVEGEEHVGLIIMAQCGMGREWGSSDAVVLKTIADQAVQALANARLRSLVKNLAVKEEKSGLLKRSSYLDILLSEISRAQNQRSPVTLMLLNFGRSADLMREVGEAAVHLMLQQIGQVVSTHVRQNDMAVRYDLSTVALILVDTDTRSALPIAEKIRGLISGLRVPGTNVTPTLTVGIAEAVMQANFDPIDVVTEVINRVEEALQIASVEGGARVRALAPESYATATS